VASGCQRGRRRSGDGRTYRSYVHNHFLEFEGFKDRQVRSIQYGELEDFKAWLGGRVAVNTCKRIMGALHAFFAWMHRRGALKQMPPWPVVEGEETVKRATDYRGQGELLQTIPDAHRGIFEFGMETGLRPNELCAPQVGDLDMIIAWPDPAGLFRDGSARADQGQDQAMDTPFG
jgi:integrase